MKRFAMVLSGVMAVGCGGAQKVDSTKLHTLKTVGLVAVCSNTEMGASGEGLMGRIGLPAELADGIREGFDRDVAKAVTIAQVAPVANADGATVERQGTGASKVQCHALNPFSGGTAPDPKPDVAYVKALAETLNVDAALVVLAHPGVTLNDDSAEIFSGSFNPSHVYLVDRSGSTVADLEVQLEATVEVDDPKQNWKTLGVAFGSALANQVGVVLSE